jgi:hypothetical protein
MRVLQGQRMVMSSKQAERLTGGMTAPATPTEPSGRALLFGRAPAAAATAATGAAATATAGTGTAGATDGNDGTAAAGGRTAGEWFKMVCFLLVAAMAVW